MNCRPPLGERLVRPVTAERRWRAESWGAFLMLCRYGTNTRDLDRGAQSSTHSEPRHGDRGRGGTLAVTLYNGMDMKLGNELNDYCALCFPPLSLKTQVSLTPQVS